MPVVDIIAMFVVVVKYAVIYSFHSVVPCDWGRGVGLLEPQVVAL